MRNIRKYISILLVAIVVASCGNKNVIFDESVIINNASWNNEDLPYFDVNIEDTLSRLINKFAHKMSVSVY